MDCQAGANKFQAVCACQLTKLANERTKLKNYRACNQVSLRVKEIDKDKGKIGREREEEREEISMGSTTGMLLNS